MALKKALKKNISFCYTRRRLGIYSLSRQFQNVSCLQRDRHPYIEYFEHSSASGGLKFEPDVPPLAGGKRGRFEIGSIAYFCTL
jgi:hypothetical protein